MSATDNILRVNNVRGVVTSLMNRGTSPKLVSQYYNTEDDEIFTLEAERVFNALYNREPIKEIPLDVVVRYSPVMSVAVTSNPVQIGVNVNDHTYNNSDTMVVNFGTSDVKGKLARLSGLISSVKTGFKDITDADTPSRLLLRLLIKAKEERTLFQLDDGLSTYSDMLITEIAYDKDKTTYRSLIATITLQQMIYVRADIDGEVAGIYRTQALPVGSSTFAKSKNVIDKIMLV